MCIGNYASVLDEQIMKECPDMMERIKEGRHQMKLGWQGTKSYRLFKKDKDGTQNHNTSIHTSDCPKSCGTVATTTRTE